MEKAVKRKPMKRSSKPMRRTKRLGAGRKKVARGIDVLLAKDHYFINYGWLEDETYCATCQVSGVKMDLLTAVAHHKQPRSELRKAGVKDLDAKERLIIVHWKCHKWIHAGKMGRPQGFEESRQFSIVENSSANAENGQQVELSKQDAFDLRRYMEGRG